MTVWSCVSFFSPFVGTTCVSRKMTRDGLLYYIKQATLTAGTKAGSEQPVLSVGPDGGASTPASSPPAPPATDGGGGGRVRAREVEATSSGVGTRNDDVARTHPPAEPKMAKLIEVEYTDSNTRRRQHSSGSSFQIGPHLDDSVYTGIGYDFTEFRDHDDESTAADTIPAAPARKQISSNGAQSADLDAGAGAGAGAVAPGSDSAGSAAVESGPTASPKSETSGAAVAAAAADKEPQ